MTYTISNDKQVNQKIQSDLDYISDRVGTLLGNDLDSILLCGGFGRGEGSVVVEGSNIHIVNDYDFTIVLDSKNRFHYLKLYKKIHGPLEALSRELAEKLDIKQVDLSPKPLSYFSGKQTLKIENYEVKMGHVLLHGKNNPTRMMPDWKASDIPLFEGTWLFRNRGAGLLIAALYFINSGRIPKEKQENFVVECTKAKLAMGDSVLLLNSRYHHLYNKRLDCFLLSDISKVPGGEKIKRMYKRAVNQKLSPDFEGYFKKDLVELWFEVIKEYNRFFHYFEQKRLGREFDTWLEYEKLPKPENRIEPKTFIKKMLTSGFTLQNFTTAWSKSRNAFTISLVPLVLFSFQKNKFNIEMMKRAADLLGISLTGHDKADWILLAKAVLNEIHPGGEAGRVIESKT
jgi:hypothetical protein